MRISRLTTFLITPLAAFALVACDSDGGGGSGGADTSDNTDTGAGNDTGSEDTGSVDEDTGNAVDTNVPQDTGGGTTGACGTTGFTSVVETLEIQAGLVGYRGASASEAPTQLISIELYQGEQYGGATTPGSYPLTGDDGNYATCGNCVLVRAQCGESSCAKTFLVDEGSLEITKLDAEGFSGTLNGAIAKEVTIDGDTFVSTLVEGGETWCLDGYAFSATPPEVPRHEGTTEDSCVADGNGIYLGANIADYSLPNCNGDMVSLHDTCDTAKALHLVGTAVWCTACSAEIDQLLSLNEVNKNNGEKLTRAKITEKTPGLDLVVILSQDNAQLEPDMAECIAYAEREGLDPAMVLIDWDETGTDVPLAMAPGFALPGVQAFAKTWENMNPYLQVSGEQVTLAWPWNAVLKGNNREFVWIDTQGPGSLDGTLNTLLSE